MTHAITEHVTKSARHTTFYLSSGAPDATPIIFVHGWPELSISWRHQLPVMAGLGFTYLPEFAVTVPGIIARPLVDPEVRRTVQLVTVRGRPHSPAIGAFVREARRFAWAGKVAPPPTPDLVGEPA